MAPSTFDYGVEGSLVFTADTCPFRPPSAPVPFQLSSHAIRYAIEVLYPAGFDFVYLEVKGRHYDETRIKELYDDRFYPLKRPSP